MPMMMTMPVWVAASSMVPVLE
eukprot:COSAG06_NODE_50153_length_320_cov_1.280543_2_plen_21_part_01